MGNINETKHITKYIKNRYCRQNKKDLDRLGTCEYERNKRKKNTTVF